MILILKINWILLSEKTSYFPLTPTCGLPYPISASPVGQMYPVGICPGDTVPVGGWENSIRVGHGEGGGNLFSHQKALSFLRVGLVANQTQTDIPSSSLHFLRLRASASAHSVLDWCTVTPSSHQSNTHLMSSEVQPDVCVKKMKRETILNYILLKIFVWFLG